MKRAVLPVVLGFAATAAIACPGADKSVQAKANTAASVTSTQPTMTQQSKADADKKLVKRAEVKKSTT